MDQYTDDYFLDPFSFINAQNDRTENSAGLICEIKTYEVRYNASGVRVPLQVGKKRKDLDLHGDRDRDSALVLSRFYDRDKDLEVTELEVHSPYIKTALQTVMIEYPGINLHSRRLIIKDLPKCLFHYRQEIEMYGRALPDPMAVQHIAFLLQHMYKTLEKEILSYYILMETPAMAPGLEFSNLWMAFRPGDYVYTRKDDIDRVLRLKSMRREKCKMCMQNFNCQHNDWELEAECIEYDGTNFGYDYTTLRIRPYEEYKPLRELQVYPLHHHVDEMAVRTAASARGNKFLSLKGKSHRMYDGTAFALSSTRKTTLFGEEDEFPLQATRINSRIMVDCATFCMARPAHKILLRQSKLLQTDASDQLIITEDDRLICSHLMPGFSLADKRWCLFQVDLIKEVEYNSDAFGTLLLPQVQKEMVLSLVRVHNDEQLRFDDIIVGKGKGMVALLHGVPGVGKTLTAESVADFARRPLYAVSSGELGVETASVYENLSEALQLATTWQAIVLIDEADVFLEQRNSHDLQRNALVSIFLRMLEYFEGILFLTTNRLRVFDDAFKSRIHVAIQYYPLSVASRRHLWETFLAKACQGVIPHRITNSFMDGLASADLNGRQIKNIVRTAYALAVNLNEDLGRSHIQKALDVMQMFQEGLGGAGLGSGGEMDSAPGFEDASKKRRLH